MCVCVCLPVQVCNHPDLFERQETRSPFHMSLKPYIMSKFLYRRGLLHTQNQAKNKWVFSHKESTSATVVWKHCGNARVFCFFCIY